MLVSTTELADHQSDPSWVVFDCRHDLMNPARGAEIYSSGHIEGAHFAGVNSDLSGVKTGSNGRHPLPDPQHFAAFLARHGVTSTSRIVAYDDVGGQYAARLWWMTRWIGHSGGAVLDGGWSKWTAEGRPVDTLAPEPKAGEVNVTLDTSLLAKIDEVEVLVTNGASGIIDARTPERYRGEVEPLDPVAGHIPGAKNHFFKNNLKENLTLKSPDELRMAFSSVGITPDSSSIIHQCGSGITACVNLLAMEHAGLTNSRLFVGSWSEWCADPKRPVANGA